MKQRPYHIAFGSLVRGTTQMRYLFCSLAAFPLGALAFQAGATDLDFRPIEQAAPSDWVITLGADARAVPRYMGSNQWAMVPVPYFDRHLPGKPEQFHSPRDGTGIALFNNGVVAIGPVGSLIWPRRQTASLSLDGLGNVGYTLQVGAFVDYWAFECCARVSRRCKALAPPTVQPRTLPWMP